MTRGFTFQRTIDHFLLRDAARVAHILETRRLRRRLALALQEGTAARELWMQGRCADALVRIREALDSLVSCLSSLAGETATPRLSVLQNSSHDGPSELLASCPDTLGSQVTPDQERWFRGAWGYVQRVDSALRDATCGEAQRRRLIRRRTLGAATLLAFAALLAMWVTDPAIDVRARASGYFESLPAFLPDNVADGRPATEWVGPNRALGWVEIELPRPLDIAGVRILNGHNAPYHDRAVRDFTLVVTDAAGERREVEGAFPRFSRAPRPVFVPLEQDDVMRVRLVVRRYYRRGAALAELSVAPRLLPW